MVRKLKGDLCLAYFYCMDINGEHGSVRALSTVALTIEYARRIIVLEAIAEHEHRGSAGDVRLGAANLPSSDPGARVNIATRPVDISGGAPGRVNVDVDANVPPACYLNGGARTV